MKSININFPFKDSPKGFFLDMNTNDRLAIKADLLHLLLTNKRERLYMPDFGVNLKKYLFEQNDGFTSSLIKEEISVAIKKYIPNLQLTELNISNSEDNEYKKIIRIDYVVTEDAFSFSDYVIIEL
jgi:phage baseplate assembly protein W